MNRKIVFRLCLLAVLIVVIQCQKKPCGPKPPSEDPPVKPLKTKKGPKFPSKEYRKLLKEDKKMAKVVKDAKRKPRYWSKSKPSPRLEASSNWSPVCPAKLKLYRLPSFIYDSQVKKWCWVLPFWMNRWSWYIDCRHKYCQNVMAAKKKGKKGPSGIKPRCYRNSWRRHYYVILCPSWRFYLRSISLPRSCQCENSKC